MGDKGKTEINIRVMIPGIAEQETIDVVIDEAMKAATHAAGAPAGMNISAWQEITLPKE